MLGGRINDFFYLEVEGVFEFNTIIALGRSFSFYSGGCGAMALFSKYLVAYPYMLHPRQEAESK